MDGRHVLDDPTLLDATHKVFLMQTSSWKFKLLYMVIRPHQRLLILRLHLTDEHGIPTSAPTELSDNPGNTLMDVLADLEEESLQFRSSVGLLPLVLVQRLHEP